MERHHPFGVLKTKTIDMEKELEELLDLGWWFSLSPKGKQWTSRIYKKDTKTKKWVTTESKTHKDVEKAMTWVSDRLAPKLLEQ